MFKPSTRQNSEDLPDTSDLTQDEAAGALVFDLASKLAVADRKHGAEQFATPKQYVDVAREILELSLAAGHEILKAHTHGAIAQEDVPDNSHAI